MCRTDLTNINIVPDDLYSIAENKDVLIVNTGWHTHPGGGGGCMQCTVDSKCNLEYHANDICDMWCMGSGDVMKAWTTVYDKALDYYTAIKSKSQDPRALPGVQHKTNSDSNEVVGYFNTSQTHLIENHVHCYYPEKIMRVLFKDAKIIGAQQTNSLWS